MYTLVGFGLAEPFQVGHCAVGLKLRPLRDQRPVARQSLQDRRLVRNRAVRRTGSDRGETPAITRGFADEFLQNDRSGASYRQKKEKGRCEQRSLPPGKNRYLNPGLVELVPRTQEVTRMQVLCKPVIDFPSAHAGAHVLTREVDGFEADLPAPRKRRSSR